VQTKKRGFNRLPQMAACRSAHTVHLSDTGSTLHVDLKGGDSPLDVYRALRRRSRGARPAAFNHIVISDAPPHPVHVSAQPLPCPARRAKPTGEAAPEEPRVSASPVYDPPTSPPARAQPALELDAEPSAADDGESVVGCLSPTALSFSSEDEDEHEEASGTHAACAEAIGLLELEDAISALAPRPAQDSETHEPVEKHDAEPPADALPSPSREPAAPARALTLGDMPPELLVAVLGCLDGDTIVVTCSAVSKTWCVPPALCSPLVSTHTQCTCCQLGLQRTYLSTH
jgi:hypothetical protein